MKTITFYIVLCCGLLSSVNAPAQALNWNTATQQPSDILHLNTGWDYGLVYGAAYAHRLNTRMPILLNVTASAPFGAQVFDDFKIKVGAQVRLYQMGHFHLSASVFGIYRRFENPLVRLQNFGSEMNAVFGYYRPRWFVAGAFGFDKAIVTHFKHTPAFREYLYAGVRDGWRIPPSGGNFHYGIQTGYSIGRSDITLSLGRVVHEDWQIAPLIPFFAELGYNWRLAGGTVR
jgi:hypothetical protein